MNGNETAMTKTDNIASFVLRFTQELWQDERGEPQVQWRGHIRHVQGDEEDRFTDFAEAVAFIQRYLTQLTLDAISGSSPMSQEKVLSESFKLWEKFASSYTGMMFQAMEQTISRSEAMKQYLDDATKKALSAWQLPTQPNQDQFVEALGKLQNQLQVLTERVERLENAVMHEQDEADSNDDA
jgi:hypothetical protein